MARRDTTTGGRAATDAVVPGIAALSIGFPSMLPEPAGFKWTALSTIARLESGHTPSRGRPEYWHGDIPWIGIRDATGNHGRVISDTEQHVTQLGIDNSSARVLPADTVCLSRTASVGYVVQTVRPMATSQDFVNWVCGPDLDPNFLRYLLMSESDSVRRFAYGSVHATMYYPDAKALHVLLPSLREQQAIAEVLGALDDKIAANIALAGTVDAYLATLFDEVASGSNITTLGSIAEVNRRTVKPVIGGSLRYVDIASVGVGSFDFPDVTAWVDAPGRARRGLSSGDTVWSTVRPNRRSHALNLESDPLLVASTGLAVLSPRKSGFAFLYEATRRPEFTTYLENVAEGSAYPAVRADRFLDAPVPDIPSDRMNAFEVQAAPLRKLVASQSRENRTLAATRDALLPQLMSGKLRVRDAERVAAEAGA